MNTLVIVDVQKDFYSKSGKLYVEGAERLPQKIVKRIKDKNYHAVILTVDSHPQNHCSFKENGGTWPYHCIKGSEGAGVADSIIEALMETNTPFYIYEKGNDENKEEYGAFSEMKRYNNPIFRFLCNDYSKKLYKILKNSDDIEVMGIAGDYCVKYTLDEMLKFIDNEKMWVNASCTKSIDDGTTLKKFCERNNISIF